MRWRPDVPTSIWLGVILVATLLPSSHANLRGGFVLADVGRNVVLFAPLGFLLARRSISIASAGLAGGLLAASIECLQVLIPGRDPSLVDLVVDGAAVALGAALSSAVPAAALFDRRAAARRGLAAGVLVAAALLLPGVASRPSMRATLYYPAWTPEPLPYPHAFLGRVLAARIGEVPFEPAGPSVRSGELREALAASAAMELLVVSDGPGEGIAPILRVNDAHGELFVVAADRDDLVVRRHGVGGDLGLEVPLFGAPGALATVRAGEPFRLTLAPRGAGWDVSVADGKAVAVGPTAGSVWRFWVGSDGLSEATRRAADRAVIATLFAIVGFWLRLEGLALAGLALSVSALAAGPWIAGLVPAPASQWAAAGVGVVLGVHAGRAARRCLAPGPSATSR